MDLERLLTYSPIRTIILHPCHKIKWFIIFSCQTSNYRTVFSIEYFKMGFITPDDTIPIPLTNIGVLEQKKVVLFVEQISGLVFASLYSFCFPIFRSRRRTFRPLKRLPFERSNSMIILC